MIKISEIIHLAADKYLSEFKNGFDHYSCIAIRHAAEELIGNLDSREDTLNIIDCGLIELGVDTEGFHEFDDIPEEHRQATRYQWLKFCALLAEEQGV